MGGLIVANCGFWGRIRKIDVRVWSGLISLIDNYNCLNDFTLCQSNWQSLLILTNAAPEHRISQGNEKFITSL